MALPRRMWASTFFGILQDDMRRVGAGLIEFAPGQEVARGVEMGVDVVGQQLGCAHVFTRAIRDVTARHQRLRELVAGVAEARVDLMAFR